MEALAVVVMILIFSGIVGLGTLMYEAYRSLTSFGE